MSASRSVCTAVIAVILFSGCSGQNLTPGGNLTSPMSAAAGASRTSAMGLARTTKPQTVTILLSEPFTGAVTVAPLWIWKDDACLTAGTSSTAPPGGIPGCSPALDPPGQGALRLTSAAPLEQGLVAYNRPLPTANGLDIQFDLHSYGSSTPADGTLVWFSSPKRPEAVGQESGSLGYLNGVKKKQTGMYDAYLGVGFDEYGNFSAVLPGGPGLIPDNIAIGGAESTGYHYLGDYSANGLYPYEISGGQSGTRSSSTVPVEIELTAAGNLQIFAQPIGASEPILCYSGNIVGLFGQPAVPSSLRFGFSSTTGADYSTHEITNLYISTLN